MNILMNNFTKNVTAGLMLISLFSACSKSDSDKPKLDPEPVIMTYSYSVSLTNLTAAQPLSPVAVVLHGGNYTPYVLGKPASVGLEMLAESGSNANFIAEANTHSHVMSTMSGAGLIMPGTMEAIDIETMVTEAMVTEGSMPMLKLSLATMLVNSNDAISGVSALDLSDLDVGESMSMMLKSYDTGTEANSETADTIPGPAAAGGTQEAFNVIRDDVMDAVLMHSGVVTMDDGLATSTLTAEHKWDNPVIELMVTRMQ